MSAVTPTISGTRGDRATSESPADPPRRMAEAIDQARAAAVDEAATELDPVLAEAAVGEHLDARVEGAHSLTHLFAAHVAGYRGWQWSVTLACAGDDAPVTVSEVVLVPGPDALVAPAWVPWQERVRPGDLGPGDLLPTAPEDPRLVPAYVRSDDPAVEEVAVEIGLGRARVLSREGRLDAAERWRAAHGPSADMARSAPARCGTCAFLVPLAGSLRAGFGVCANEYAPVDGTVVSVEFGCGAHSEVEVDTGSPVHVAALVYDDGVDLEVVADVVPVQVVARAGEDPGPADTAPAGEFDTTPAGADTTVPAGDAASGVDAGGTTETEPRAAAEDPAPEGPEQSGGTP